MSRTLFFFVFIAFALGGFFFLFFQMPDTAPQSASNLDVSNVPVVSEGRAVPPEEKLPETLSEPLAPKEVLYAVPFTSQAPFAEWGKPLFQNACEEASVYMAELWRKGRVNISKEDARDAIIGMSAWEEEKLGHSIDTDAQDTEKYLLQEYLGLEGSELAYDFTLSQMKLALGKGIIIVPTNGQKLGNPNFTRPGPLTHMLVIIGYDPVKKEFITNDPGTRLGAKYRYKEDILFSAIRNYPTGKHLPIKRERKAMIIIPELSRP